MGLRGTEVAKEAADVVLADDNFATILKAVEGGRTIYANITKFVHMMFSHNLGEVLMIFTAIAAGWPLPLLPLQILWMNLVTDVFPALALAVEPGSTDLMNQPPRSSRRTFLSKPFLILIGWQAAMLAALGLGAYIWALRVYGPGSHSRTIALFTLVSVQLAHTFNCRSRTRALLHSSLLSLCNSLTRSTADLAPARPLMDSSETRSSGSPQLSSCCCNSWRSISLRWRPYSGRLSR